MWYFVGVMGGFAAGIIVDEMFAGNIKAEILALRQDFNKIHDKLNRILDAVKGK